ncbi:MAG: right-handed parallel beta-helix repeat-containing protein [Sedimentisphaerales bacterium]|nr:right-handed parallel beta-helix repeat-containing protein [Sedimentisphaerales bacterium]
MAFGRLKSAKVHSNTNIIKSNFVYNGAEWGAGIRNIESSPVITRCIFHYNLASEGGGAIENEFNSNPLISNCILRSNAAFWHRGGAIYNYENSEPKIYNSLMTNNQSWDGGAIANELNCAAEIINCTISHNHSKEYGAGIYSTGDSNCRVTNSILWENIADANSIPTEQAQIYDANSIPKVDFCCIEGLDTLSGKYNIGDDPLFVDPDGTDGIIGSPDDNFLLMPDSPCINMGNNYALPFGGIVNDLSGNSRIVNKKVDMGVYEFYFKGDIDNDGDVDMLDFVRLAENWLAGIE